MEPIKTYRLEFNEKQQCYHMDDGHHEPGTHGWFTISEHCSDIEFHIFDAYVNRVKIDKLTKEYLLQCLSEVEGFIKNLTEYRLAITKM